MSELRKLLEAATPGPWGRDPKASARVCAPASRSGAVQNFSVAACHGMQSNFEDFTGESEANANLIVHLRNNADKYAGMEERIAELESQLEASQGALREQMKARRDACAKLEAVEERYFDLIMCVSRKFPGELRHDTAKRYITESETATCDGQAKAALQGDGGQE